MVFPRGTLQLASGLANARRMSSLVENTSKITKGIGRLLGDNVMMTSGKGSYVELSDGRKMLDFTTGIGVVGLGRL